MVTGFIHSNVHMATGFTTEMVTCFTLCNALHMITGLTYSSVLCTYGLVFTMCITIFLTHQNSKTITEPCQKISIWSIFGSENAVSKIIFPVVVEE